MSDGQVHRARKSLKQARAALRLLRDGLGEALFRERNEMLRDIGRHLSPLRDATANVETFDRLRARFEKRIAGIDWEARRKTLLQTLEEVGPRIARRSRQLGLAGKLRDPRLASAARVVDASQVERGFRRIYKKGREAFEAACAARTPEAFHEWRKQVKYLLNALDGLDGAGEKEVRRMRKRAHELADHLGKDHDLFVLAGRWVGRSRDSRLARTLLPLVDRRRRKLQKKAERLGRKLYGRRPRKVAEALFG